MNYSFFFCHKYRIGCLVLAKRNLLPEGSDQSQQNQKEDLDGLKNIKDI
jgi:hypothetical protein